MRRFITITTTILLALVVANAALAQVRGVGRLQGVVVEKGSGKPLAGATVTVAPASANTAPIVVKTDSKGRWTALGLTSGSWNIDISMPGYATLKGAMSVQEHQMVPPLKSELALEEQQQQTATVQASPLVPKDAVDAIKEGQDFLAAGKFKEAVADFEKALPQVPTDKPEVATVRIQLQEVLAQAYYKAGDLKNAIATLERLNTTDPWTTPDANQTARQVLLANLYLENSQLDEAKTLVEKLPAGAITDSIVYENMGVLAFNKKKAADAEAYFTKAIDVNPKSYSAYYYRGLAKMQLKHDKDAKADFQQVLALAPAESPEAHDAKQLVASIK